MALRATPLLLALALGLLLVRPLAGAPLGVSPKHAALYAKPEFTCLDGSRSFPSSRVNDDFCDCPDGSDEPGTAACAFRFFCMNAGYKGRYLFSSQVNDGLCDCCDGSDEGRVGACPNMCASLAAEETRKQSELADAMARSVSQNAEHAKEGARRRVESRQKEIELKARVEMQERDLESLLAQLATAEASETEQYNEKMNEFEASGGKRMAVLRALYIETLGAGDLTDVLYHLGVSGATDWRTLYVTMKNFLNETYSESDIPTDVPNTSVFSEQMGFGSWPEAQLQDFIVNLVELTNVSGEIRHFSDPNRDSSPIEAASYAFHYKSEEAENLRATLRPKQDDLEDTKRSLAAESAVANSNLPDLELGYRGECVTGSFGFSYELCLFTEAKQNSLIGHYSHREGLKHFYTGGESCSGGQARSATVTMQCGMELKIDGVSEPSTCQYEIQASGPLACTAADVEKLRQPLSFEVEAELYVRLGSDDEESKPEVGGSALHCNSPSSLALSSSSPSPFWLFLALLNAAGVLFLGFVWYVLARHGAYVLLPPESIGPVRISVYLCLSLAIASALVHWCCARRSQAPPVVFSLQ